ncbi:hypothetical protein [Microcoleus sp. CAWBG640]|uniref:hypothetical protein n=1 Tax=Microcoleus sp. CAWBG640 TaxID=2841653 RepID=UPI00312B64C1
MRRFTDFARSSRYVLQCDIRKYFASIDHEILKSLLHRKLKCADTLWLVDKIKEGANFLGFRILPDRIRVRTENLRRAKRRLQQMQVQYAKGEMELSQITQSLQSWAAHLKHGDTWQLRQQIFASLVFARK